MSEIKTYEVLESFAVRSGVQVLPGEVVELTEDQARAYLHYGRIRLKPPAPPEEDEELPGGAEVEDRDPAPAHRDPTRRRRR